MTEIISATTTVLDAAMACFERVQIARSFDDDLNSHRIKLDIIQLRLSRWGEAAGLYTSTSDSKGGEGANGDGAQLSVDHEAAKDLLKAITDQFTIAQTEAAKLQPQSGIDPAKDEDLSGPHQTLRGKLRAALARRRAKLVKASYSLQWAFYKKDQFDAFVVDLSETIDDLEALFPKEEATERFQELGASECAGIPKTYLKVLSSVTENFDPYLNAAVAEALKPRQASQGGNVYFDAGHSVSYGQQMAQMSGTQTGFSFGTQNKYGKGTTNYYGTN